LEEKTNTVSEEIVLGIRENKESLVLCYNLIMDNHNTAVTSIVSVTPTPVESDTQSSFIDPNELTIQFHETAPHTIQDLTSHRAEIARIQGSNADILRQSISEAPDKTEVIPQLVKLYIEGYIRSYYDFLGESGITQEQIINFATNHANEIFASYMDPSKVNPNIARLVDISNRLPAPEINRTKIPLILQARGEQTGADEVWYQQYSRALILLDPLISQQYRDMEVEERTTLLNDWEDSLAQSEQEAEEIRMQGEDVLVNEERAKAEKILKEKIIAFILEERTNTYKMALTLVIDRLGVSETEAEEIVVEMFEKAGISLGETEPNDDN